MSRPLTLQGRRLWLHAFYKQFCEPKNEHSYHVINAISCFVLHVQKWCTANSPTMDPYIVICKSGSHSTCSFLENAHISLRGCDPEEQHCNSATNQIGSHRSHPTAPTISGASDHGCRVQDLCHSPQWARCPGSGIGNVCRERSGRKFVFPLEISRPLSVIYSRVQQYSMSADNFTHLSNGPQSVFAFMWQLDFVSVVTFIIPAPEAYLP